MKEAHEESEPTRKGSILTYDEILQEKSFKRNKDKALPIFERYNSFNAKKANQLLECGTSLWFSLKEHRSTKERVFKLSDMFTCKDRFCPFCNWRRSMKYSRLVYEHLKALEAKKPLRYIFLTLTVKNCHISDLRHTIKLMQEAFNRMSKTVRWKNSILGYLRVLEYTIQADNANMIHPHFHTLLVVPTSYFKTSQNLYLKKTDYAHMWQKALKVDYSPVVDIRIVKPNKQKDANLAVVAEMTKYPMKDTDLSRLSNDNFELLVKELKGVRNINAGGILKGILRSTEKIDDDLVNIDEEDCNDSELWVLLERVLYRYQSKSGKLDYHLEKISKINSKSS